LRNRDKKSLARSLFCSLSLQASPLYPRIIKTLSMVESYLHQGDGLLRRNSATTIVLYFFFFNNEMKGFFDRNLANITLSCVLVLPWPVYIEFFESIFPLLVHE